MYQQKQEEGEEAYKFKMVMLGDPNTGKTSLVQRYVYDQYNAQGAQSTIGVDVLKKTVVINDQTVKLNLWDTGGQDKYSSLTDMYFRKTLGYVLVYDITESSSFDSLDYWMKKLKDKALDDVVIFLAGNKIDAEEQRQIDKEDIEKYIEKNKIITRHYLVSAKEGDNVNNIFQDLAEEVIERINKGILQDENNKGQQQNNNNVVIDTQPKEHIKDKVKKPECC